MIMGESHRNFSLKDSMLGVGNILLRPSLPPPPKVYISFLCWLAVLLLSYSSVWPSPFSFFPSFLALINAKE